MQRASVFNDNADARCVILGLYRHFLGRYRQFQLFLEVTFLD